MSEVALTLRKIFHRGSYRIGLFFPYNPAVNARLKTLGAGYSATQKCRYVDYTAAKYKLKNHRWLTCPVQAPISAMGSNCPGIRIFGLQ